jgi:ABC-type multidrug transport system ATPase subunit
MILKVDQIDKAFGRNKVLKNVSFEMNSASLVGIVGENGSGKSTLLKIIVGERNPDRGKISVSGPVGYCPQETLLFSHLTVDEHFSYFAGAYGIAGSELSERSEWLMDYFNFRKYRHARTGTLSGGTQQKLNLSIALLHRPELLILDEPYNGFDWETYLTFWKLTDILRRENCAILVVTHMLTEKDRFDRIFNLVSGQLS